MKKIILIAFLLNTVSVFASTDPCFVSADEAKQAVTGILEAQKNDFVVSKSCEAFEKGKVNVIVDDNYSLDLWQVSGIRHLGNTNCVISKVEFVEADASRVCK